MMNEQIRIPVTLMRGGTRTGVFLSTCEVPREPEARRRFLLALFESPDTRQIDGLGGADFLASKCAVIGPPSRSGADIDYTFAQGGIVDAFVSYEMVFGDVSSETGVYALHDGLVQANVPITFVRVHNPSTGKVLRAAEKLLMAGFSGASDHGAAVRSRTKTAAERVRMDDRRNPRQPVDGRNHGHPPQRDCIGERAAPGVIGEIGSSDDGRAWNLSEAAAL